MEGFVRKSVVCIPETLDDDTGYKEASADYFGASLHLSEISESKHIPVWYPTLSFNARIVLFFFLFKITLYILSYFIDFCEISDRSEFEVWYAGLSHPIHLSRSAEIHIDF